MQRRSQYLANVVAATAVVLAAVAASRAETWTLELKRGGVESLYRAASPQRFYIPIGGDGKSRIEFPGTAEQAAAFKRIVKKEPNYESAHPLRGVAKLGSQEYAFAIDKVTRETKQANTAADTVKTAAKPDSAIADLADKLAQALLPSSPSSAHVPGYNRLYFDLNHNGDLTDDAYFSMPSEEMSPYGPSFQFPRVDVAIDVDGAKMDYSFLLSGYVNPSEGMDYAVVSLSSAVYREGDVTLEGKKHHVILLDFNSNGRFDDETTLPTGQPPNEPLYPESGDMLMIDPHARGRNGNLPYESNSDDMRHAVAKLIRFGGRYYDLRVSPTGDELTLTPSSVRLGSVANPNKAFHAVVYGDKGFFAIEGNKETPASVPEGQWKLLNYTIGQTEYEKPITPAEKKEEPKTEASPLQTLVDALEGLLGGSEAADSAKPRSRETTAMAQATAGYKPITVRAGETVTMPFGPPYTPTVTASPADRTHARLSMSLIGSAGEVCTSLIIDGSRPQKPAFVISDPSGKSIETGNFEYG